MYEKITSEDVEIKASRSGGSGGQNVNKVNTKITIYFDIKNSPKLSPSQKDRFTSKYINKMNVDGLVIIISDEHRTQKLNLDESLKKLNLMIQSIAIPPKKRVKTKPTFSSKVKRMDSKKKRGDIKKMRSEKF